MALFDELFCTDADVAGLAAGDYPLLVPADQSLASGTDGSFAAGSPWTLLSAGSSFATRGLEPLCVCVLTKGVPIPNDILIVDTVDPVTGGATLKRKGLPSGLGNPPVSGSAPVGGITFSFPSCLVQIAEASRILRERYRMLSDADLQAMADLRRPCILIVLTDLYEARYRTTANDAYKAKAADYRAQLADQYATLDRTYGIGPEGRRPALRQPPPTFLVPKLSTDPFRYPDSYGGPSH